MLDLTSVAFASMPIPEGLWFDDAEWWRFSMQTILLSPGQMGICYRLSLGDDDCPDTLYG